MKHVWLNKSDYPFSANYFDINGYQMHYIDEGKGDTILFVHGTPSWSFDFRQVIKKLSPNFRCIAIDHIGFGLSDKPEHYDYTIQNHCKTLEKFIVEKELTGITLVVHDFGGPIGFNFAIQYPTKIKRIVVLNSWMWSSQKDPDFIKLSKILKSPLLPFLYRYLNFSPKYILPQSFGNHPISAPILKQYTKPFANPSQRNGALAFAKSLLTDQDWFEDLWHKKSSIANKPLLLIWGMKDPILKPSYLEKFRSGFNNTKIIQLDSCGHFPQEEKPDEVELAIFKFMKDI